MIISDSGKEILDFFFEPHLINNLKIIIKIRKDEFLRKEKIFSLKARLGLRFEMSESFREFIVAPTYNTVKDNTEN